MKKELQILKNEYGVFYIADKDGNIQYHQGTKILASKDIEGLKKYLNMAEEERKI
jgi:hypothetical protein